jgi:hypothetical protein
MPESFTSVYEAWGQSNGDRKAELEAVLAASYRAAWNDGDLEDRFVILSFILLRREKSGGDLVAEGLRANDVGLASHAGAVALCLISWGFDLGPTIRHDLNEFAKRFPDWAIFGTGALKLLDSRESSSE